MTESKTWLPRFQPGDLADHSVNTFTMLRPEQICERINNRLEEFEQTCKRMVSNNGFWRSEMMTGYDQPELETLMLPPRKIQPGVSKREIVERLKRRKGFKEFDLELADRIEREGIIE